MACICGWLSFEDIVNSYGDSIVLHDPDTKELLLKFTPRSASLELYGKMLKIEADSSGCVLSSDRILSSSLYRISLIDGNYRIVFDNRKSRCILFLPIKKQNLVKVVFYSKRWLGLIKDIVHTSSLVI